MGATITGGVFVGLGAIKTPFAGLGATVVEIFNFGALTLATLPITFFVRVWSGRSRTRIP